ncbi:hypothetical protein ACHAXR_010457, partial [Thalassiosira sp. AJA248-18]
TGGGGGGFGSAAAATAPVGAAAPSSGFGGGGTGFGSSSAATATPFGGKSTSGGNVSGFGTGNRNPGFGGGGGGSTAKEGSGGFRGGFGGGGGGGNQSSSNTTPPPGFGGGRLSTPAKDATATTGFGTSSSTTFGQSGGTTTTGGGFGGSGGPTTTSTTSTTTPFGGGGGGGGTSSPFGQQRIPRKEWVRNKDQGGGGGQQQQQQHQDKEWTRNKDQGGGGGQQQQQDTTAAGAATTTSSGDAAGDDHLAALRKKIQDKRKKLLKMKQDEQQQPGQEVGGAKDKNKSATATTSTSSTLTNAELAAKNARRFGTASNDDRKGQTLNKLLPSDLRTAATGGTDNTTSAWSTPTDTEEEDGVVDDILDNDRDVNNAKSLIGICTSMCPDEELLRREKEGDIQLLEIPDPGGLHPASWTLRDTAVKRFRRSAADFKLDIPELVRTPEVLERVCGYLEEWVMERDRQGIDKRWAASTQPSDTPPPLDVYQFIWDRTRMIRKDFILQNYIGTGGNCDARAVRIHERIARWHAMCEHQLAHIPDFVSHQSQQNIAELGQTMKTLNMYYDDALGRSLTEVNGGNGGTSSPQGCGSDIVMGKSPVDFDGTLLSNTPQSEDVSKRIIGSNGVKSSSHGTAEPEMRGLYILLTLNNEGGMEVLKYSGRLCVQKPAIFYSKPVQLALSIFQAKKDHNYARFFSLLRSPSTPYLYACIMFKYVENMRKDALTIMSRTYGAKHKTTGQPFFDSYPLENLVKLLCYEDVEEAQTACRHYGLTVEGDQVLWRHSKFGEPRDPQKGHIIPLKPRKMMRTIESKLKGATRLSVCRGGVSGEGATLSDSSTGSDAAAEADREKAREAADIARKEAMQRRMEEEAKARAQAEKLAKERMRKEKLAAEERARAEAANRAKMERLQKEHIARERVLAEQRRKEEEARRLAEARAAAARAEMERQEREAREREEARKRAEEEKKERERQRLLAKQREEEARRLAEIKAAKERAEKERREQEERRRAEEERIRKAREEEARRIEMMWRQKIEKARKVLAWRLWRKQMHKHETHKMSRRSLDSLDPTSTHYPAPLRKEASSANHGFHSDSAITGHDAAEVELENQIYRLATASRQPINLSKMTAECFMNSSTHDITYPPTVISNKNISLFKLVVLLPKRTPGTESLYDTLRMWVNSHLSIGHVSSHIFKRRSHHTEVRTVAVIGNEDPAKCKDCNAALLLLPSAAGVSSRIEFPEDKMEELLDSNVPRVVLVLGDRRSSGNNQITEDILDHIVGNLVGTDQHRQGVAAPKVCHFDSSFQKCCETLVMSHFESTINEGQINSHMQPSMARVKLSNLGFLCLQRLIQNMDAEGFFGTATSFEDLFFTSCQKALDLMVHELSHANNEVHSALRNWPPLEFWEEATKSIPAYFDGQYRLPSSWRLPPSDFKVKVFSMFQQLLGKEPFAVFVEMYSQKLPHCMKQNLLVMLDNGEISSCFANVVSLFVNGELSLEHNEEMLLYLPVERMSQVIERAATYSAPPTPEPVLVEIPSYLYQKTSLEEEKENSRSENAIHETPEIKPVNKRRPPEMIEPERLKNERVKRIRSNAPNEETEEQRRSKEFTSFLEALL